MNQPIAKSTVVLFVDLIRRGIESWIEAGEIAAREIDKDPEWADKVCDVLMPGGETLLVDVMNLKPAQAEQVIGFDRIRSLAEQRAWMENAAQATPPARANLPYRIVGKKLICMAGCTFERKELAKLLAEMD